MLGTLLSLQKRIMSPPANVWTAEHKIFQLALAQNVGLSVPETVVTNKPAEVTDAFKRFGGNMISKAVRSGFAETDSEQLAIYTSQVLEEHLARVEDARWSPAIYQPLISKKCDVRVTVVGNRLFSVEIESQCDPASLIDWRRTTRPDLPHRSVALPKQISKGIHRLVKRLGLAFAAIDLIRTLDDKYVFLEVNPNGQWLWLDEILELGISESIADWLSS
jgi:glutathione synthase/RimK-type ligase-like ATP-grasp enzyme